MIADRLELPFPRAGALKVDYARGISGEREADVRGIVADDVAVWAAGVELVMEELAAGDQLPGRIYLCGGGSRLPEVREALAAGDKKAAEAQFRETVSAIDKAIRKGTIHRNAAARYRSVCRKERDH